MGRNTASGAELEEVLRSRVRPAAKALARAEGAGEGGQEPSVRCLACGHRCLVHPGRRGICKVRFNQDGRLLVPGGYVSGLAIDPVEKKPFFHVLPGARALSFGMLGCDLHCGYCQNWITSQALRDPRATAGIREITAEELVEAGVRNRTPLVVSTYNEPLITAEWAAEIFRRAVAAGMLCGFVSNGNGTSQVLEYLRPVTRLFKIDLKGFRKETYRELGGVLERVLETIQAAHDTGFWVEVVTLVVPGFNDSEGELRGIARFLAGVDRNLPWHVTAFHRDYKMTGRADTGIRELRKAARIGKEEGLRFVYAGNLPGRDGRMEDTVCPGCGTCLIRREGFHVLSNRIGADGSCPDCGESIPGLWTVSSDPPGFSERNP